MNWERDWYNFTEDMHVRMEKGQQEYGDTSFETAPKETVKEIQEELLDVANWAFILWRKIDKLVV